MGRQKDEVITFKAEQALLDALKAVPNRSAFIRNALLAALQNTCPLCGGRGTLSPRQRQHWEDFATSHAVVECDDCHEMHIVCAGKPRRRAKRKRYGESP